VPVAVISPESLAGFRINGGAVVAMQDLVLSSEKTVPRLALFINAAFLRLLAARDVSKKSAPVCGCDGFCGVVMHDNLPVTPEPIGGMVDGCSEFKQGLDKGFQKTAAATSAHDVCTGFGMGAISSNTQKRVFSRFSGKNAFY
jgi:hypothetical protein